MPPAARITDMHTCPMVDPGPKPHVGGPISGPCAPTVLIGNLLAARVTDMAVCVGPPDVIVKGSPTVLICNLLAARMGDTTAHGGVIVVGCPTVIIGEQGSGSGLSPGMGGGALSNAMGAAASSGSGGPGGSGGTSGSGGASNPQSAALQEAAQEGVPLVEKCPFSGHA